MQPIKLLVFGVLTLTLNQAAYAVEEYAQPADTLF